MSFEVFPWQQQNWELLSHYILSKRPPQALLISGGQGLGKLQLAQQFAKALICKESHKTGFYCSQCSSCRLFDAQTHPDFITLTSEEEGKIIGIDSIRELIGKLALKPQFETQRVVLIYPADKLNNAAANGFLKCLEEPTERTCIILITEKPTALPATISSRCQKLIVPKPSTEIAIQWLNNQQIYDNTSVLLSLAQGSPLLAKDYANEQLLNTRLEYFNDWLNLSKSSQNLLEIADKWHKQQPSAIMLWLTTWVSDVIKCRFDLENTTLTNPDLIQPLQALARQLNLKKLFRFYDLLLKSQKQLETQINKQLLFEEILLQWSTLNKER